MQNNLYIPKKIHVGFQNRSDTFTGKLGYVIYEDEKGVLRKKDSWESWRDKNINQVVLDNIPTRFVFNKGVQRYGYFGSGRSAIRVYDHRDFEFEITVDNLIGILMHSDISKRDIVEECVFAWAGKELVLLPVNSEEYQMSVKYTDKQSLKISSKDLVIGHTYEKKKSSGQVVYIGYFDFYNMLYMSHCYVGKKHVFYDFESKQFVTPSVSALAKSISEEVHADFAKLNERFFNSFHSKEMKKIEISNKTKGESYCYFFKQIDSTTFIRFAISNHQKTVNPNNNLCFHILNVKKENKNISIELHSIENNILFYGQAINNLFKELKIDWQFNHKKYNSSYYYNSFTGTPISKSELSKMLRDNGFGQDLVFTDDENKQYSITQ